MLSYETATNRCPRCGRTFRTLADEYGTHECPYCGYYPEEWAEEEEEECYPNSI
jgi:rRNA maturation endonuclease Nob1